MSNKNKRTSIKEKRAYNNSDLKRKGDFSVNLKEVLLKKLKTNEGNPAIISQKEGILEKNNEKDIIRVSTSGKSMKNINVFFKRKPFFKLFVRKWEKNGLFKVFSCFFFI